MQMEPAAPIKAGAPTLIVSIPRAAAGFDNYQIVYIRLRIPLSIFGKANGSIHRQTCWRPWSLPPWNGAVGFSAVIPSPTSAAGQLRLDVEIVRLQHEFLILQSKSSAFHPAGAPSRHSNTTGPCLAGI